MKNYYPVIEGLNFSQEVFDSADYNMMVYWAVFMKRQTRRLLKQSKEIVAKHPDKKINIYYINTDPLFRN
jgi:hypothetical protein